MRAGLGFGGERGGEWGLVGPKYNGSNRTNRTNRTTSLIETEDTYR